MKRLMSLTLALLMALTLFAASGARTYTYAEDGVPEPTAEPETEAEAPVNPFVGLWEITGHQDGETYTSSVDSGVKAYLDFLPNGAIYAVMISGDTATEDYLAYKVTGENTLDIYEGEDALPAVFDPETGAISVRDPESELVSFVERVTEDPLPDIRAMMDHSQEERTWYGYAMSQSGQTVNLLETLPAMGMDPHDFFLTLSPDGTGYLQFGEEESGGEITWTEDQLISKESPDEPVTYTRLDDHILFEADGVTVEFAPEGEVEALLAVLEADRPETAEADVSAEDLVGEWKLTKADAAGQTLTAEQLKEQGLDMSFRFNEDGTASMTSNGTTQDKLGWELQDNGVKLKAVSGSSSMDIFTFSFEDGYLVLNYIAKLYFEKTE